MPESIEELLDEIGSDHSAAAVQENTVAMKRPAVQLCNFIGHSRKNERAEGISIERK